MHLQRWTLCIAIAALAGGCPLDISVDDDDLEGEWQDEDESEEADEWAQTDPVPDDGSCGRGDDGDDDGDGGHDFEDCYAVVFEACIGEDAGPEQEPDAGGYRTSDPQEDDPYAICDEIARSSCEDLEEGDGDGWCESEPEPEPDCFTEVYEECIASGGCEEECSAVAEESCYPVEPEPEPDCYTEVFESCLADGGCEEDCWAQAEAVCSEPAPCDDTYGEPRCTPPEEDPGVVAD